MEPIFDHTELSESGRPLTMFQIRARQLRNKQQALNLSHTDLTARNSKFQTTEGTSNTYFIYSDDEGEQQELQMIKKFNQKKISEARRMNRRKNIILQQSSWQEMTLRFMVNPLQTLDDKQKSMAVRFLSDFSGLNLFRLEMSILMFREFMKSLISKSILPNQCLYSKKDEDIDEALPYPSILAIGKIKVQLEFSETLGNRESKAQIQNKGVKEIVLDHYKGCLNPNRILVYLKSTQSNLASTNLQIVRVDTVTGI